MFSCWEAAHTLCALCTVWEKLGGREGETSGKAARRSLRGEDVLALQEVMWFQRPFPSSFLAHPRALGHEEGSAMCV